MINVSDTQVRAVFAAEGNDVDVVVASACSCINPTQMFFYTSKELVNAAAAKRGCK